MRSGRIGWLVGWGLVMWLGWDMVSWAPAQSNSEPDSPAVENLPAGALVRLGSWDPNASAALGHTTGVYELAFVPQGRYLVSRGMDDTIRVWDLEHPPQHLRLQASKPMALSAQGDLLAAVGEGATVKLWRLPEGKELLVLNTEADFLGFRSPRELVVVSRGVVTVYETASGRKVGQDVLVRMQAPLALSEDGRLLAYTISLYNTTVHCFDLRRRRPVGTFTGKTGQPICAAFSPGATLLACGGRHKLTHLWEVSSGRLLHKLSGHQGPVQAVAFSPDGRWIATGSWDKTAIVWEVASGRRIITLRGHRKHVAAVAFSSDGKRLATGSTDRTIVVWDLDRLILGTPHAATPLQGPELDQLWDQLASPDAAKAYEAMGRLIAAPGPTVELVQRKLRSLLQADQQQRITELIAQLDDPRYMVRERATKQLARMLVLARPLLEKHLRETLSAEVRFRIRKLLALPKSQSAFSPEEVYRLIRVVQVLQRIHSPEAKKILQQMARSVPDVQVMQQAQAALEEW